MNDELVWTDAGRAALDEELADRTLRAASEGELRAKIAAVTKRFAPCWRRGAEKSDETGRAGIELACGAWDVARLDAADAAKIASLVGARSDDDGGAFAELLVRARGVRFAMEALVEAWSLVTDYDDPDWPKSEARLAIRLRAIGPESSSAQDASVSHGKGDLATYLSERVRVGTDEERVEASAAARALWTETPMHARAPLAYASRDRALVEEIMRDLLDDKTPSHPHFAMRVLPALVRDEALVRALRDDDALPFTWAWLADLGAAALPHYEALIDQRKTGKWLRARMIEQLVNVRGPRAAAVLARYASKADSKKAVRAYFQRWPELAPPGLGAVKASPKKRI